MAVRSRQRQCDRLYASIHNHHSLIHSFATTQSDDDEVDDYKCFQCWVWDAHLRRGNPFYYDRRQNIPAMGDDKLPHCILFGVHTKLCIQQHMYVKGIVRSAKSNCLGADIGEFSFRSLLFCGVLLLSMGCITAISGEYGLYKHILRIVVGLKFESIALCMYGCKLVIFCHGRLKMPWIACHGLHTHS